jgi:hypothetical protein
MFHITVFKIRFVLLKMRLCFYSKIFLLNLKITDSNAKELSRAERKNVAKAFD